MKDVRRVRIGAVKVLLMFLAASAGCGDPKETLLEYDSPCTRTNDCADGFICHQQICHLVATKATECPATHNRFNAEAGVCERALILEDTCDNGVRDDGEVGVDCGGACKACQAAPTCGDSIQNQGELGVDCGGPCPASR